MVKGWIKFQFNFVISQLTLERLHFLHWKLLVTLLELESIFISQKLEMCLDNLCTLDIYLSSFIYILPFISKLASNILLWIVILAISFLILIHTH